MPRPPYSSLQTNVSEKNNKYQILPDVQLQTQIQCFGYRYNRIKIFIYIILNLLLLGIPYLIGRWYAQWKVYFNCTPTFLRNATVVLLQEDNQYFFCNVRMDPIDFLPDGYAQKDGGNGVARASSSTAFNSPMFSKPIFRHFTFRYEEYLWDDSKDCFRKLEGMHGVSCTEILCSYSGLSHSKQIQLKSIYGPNLIDVEVKGYWRLLFDEVLNPFYVFQLFSVCLWSFDNYYVYAGCIVVISAVSIIITLVETRRQMEVLREMAIGSDDFLVSVRRSNGEEEEICIRDLVPGDVILVPPEGFIMPCDAVVTNGTCIVNESMLTGESIPVRKTPIAESDDYYDCEIHKRHTVFAGTQVIQTRFYGGNKISCVVVRTGFSTLKGNLIRSMMFPKDSGLDFYRDAMRFVATLFLFSVCGMIYCLYLYVNRGTSWIVMLVRVLDIVTIAVPPALPAALTVGTFYAQSRLKRRQIYCISPPKINYCGKLQLICFDKTGTLTEDGLDFSCVVPCVEDNSGKPSFLEPVYEARNLPPTSEVLRGMASCHSLTHIKGNIVGDPLDLKMFEATGWELIEPMNSNDTRRYDLLTPTVLKMDDVEIGLIREFEFTPQLQRMSVVVKTLDSPFMTLYCKGSPEKVSPFCSNLPENYDLMLDSFTVKGFRVLALGQKIVKGLHWHQVQRCPREEMEKDLIFTGFLVMQNSLKPVTMSVIKELKAGDFRSVMVTGDNALTAISVARECGMIPSCDKIVIVNATEEGGIEYTLAAHHYESDNPTEYELNSSRRTSVAIEHSIKSRSGSEGRTRATSVTSEYVNQKSRRESEEDTRIHIDRLVAITSHGFTSESKFVTLDSKYHFVVTGKTWEVLCRYHPKSTLDRILAKGTVYARMSPEYKRQLIESLQNIGYVVGMVGDGANDCSALKMAHVGISLSEAEASVAAPFTSKVPDISCVPHLIREGRCALVTSFGMFKYMALYSLVQFVAVLGLYTFGSNLADAQFLYIDLGITTGLAIVMGRTEPYDIIVPKRPIGRLSSGHNILSIVCQVLVCVSVQLGALFFLTSQPWYTPVRLSSGDDIEKLCWENTTLFTVSAFQYLILALVLSKGPPYRKPFYTNGFFVIFLLVLTLTTVILTIPSFSWVAWFFGLMPMEDEKSHFRYMLLIFPAANLIVSLIIEKLLSSVKGKFGALRFKKTQYKYQEILYQIEKDVSWPRVRCS